MSEWPLADRRIDIREPSEWRCWITPGPLGLCIVPVKGGEPNVFHRFMQRLAFGFKWERLSRGLSECGPAS